MVTMGTQEPYSQQTHECSDYKDTIIKAYRVTPTDNLDTSKVRSLNWVCLMYTQMVGEAVLIILPYSVT